MIGPIAAKPRLSFPQQAEKWADIKAGYRFFSHPDITPDGIQQGHRDIVRENCAKHTVVLCVQDTSVLDFTSQKAMKNLGKIGAKQQEHRGFHQHSALAMTPEGQTLGLLHQRWYLRPERPEGETAAQRRKRWVEGDVWEETAKTIGKVSGCKLIHVGDRGADIASFFQACQAQDAGFVVRAQHDRCIENTDEGEDKKEGEEKSEGKSEEENQVNHLWSLLEKQPECGRIEAEISPQPNARKADRRTPRKANLSVRFAQVTITPHRQSKAALWAVYVREESADKTIEEGEPVEWMLLTSEDVKDFESARKIVVWYMRRWRIEEFHRALKEGCSLEKSQLDDAKDVERLSAVLSIIAIRMLQLRDMARPDSPHAEDPQMLQAWAPEIWIKMVAFSEKIPEEKLTPRQFLRGIAKKGGFIGRKGDGHPGWKTLWQGWTALHFMCIGAEAMLEHLKKKG